jgi:hypothetical protein
MAPFEVLEEFTRHSPVSAAGLCRIRALVEGQQGLLVKRLESQSEARNAEGVWLWRLAHSAFQQATGKARGL